MKYSDSFIRRLVSYCALHSTIRYTFQIDLVLIPLIKDKLIRIIKQLYVNIKYWYREFYEKDFLCLKVCTITSVNRRGHHQEPSLDSA